MQKKIKMDQKCNFEASISILGNVIKNTVTTRSSPYGGGLTSYQVSEKSLDCFFEKSRYERMDGRMSLNLQVPFGFQLGTNKSPFL